MTQARARLVRHILATVVLMGSGMWLSSDLSWEPFLAVLAALPFYVGTGRALLSKYSRFSDVSKDELRALCARVFEEISETDGSSISIESLLSGFGGQERSIISAAIHFLQNLGLISVDEYGRASAISERSSAFLSSIYLSFAQSTELGGDWKAEGQNNKEAMKIRRALRYMEMYRISLQGQPAIPSRKVESAIVLVKGRYKKEDHFLMQYSSAWHPGYYWFIGGIKEDADPNMEACAVRELGEELGIKPIAINSLKPLGLVHDKRISKRVGALTEYQYSVFSVTLDSSDPDVEKCHKLDFKLESHVDWAEQERQCRWLSWQDIKSNVHLRKDAPSLISYLDSLDRDQIPRSTTVKLRKSE